MVIDDGMSMLALQKKTLDFSIKTSNFNPFLGSSNLVFQKEFPGTSYPRNPPQHIPFGNTKSTSVTLGL